MEDLHNIHRMGKKEIETSSTHTKKKSSMVYLPVIIALSTVDVVVTYAY